MFPITIGSRWVAGVRGAELVQTVLVGWAVVIIMTVDAGVFFAANRSVSSAVFLELTGNLGATAHVIDAFQALCALTVFFARNARSPSADHLVVRTVFLQEAASSRDARTVETGIGWQTVLGSEAASADAGARVADLSVVAFVMTPAFAVVDDAGLRVLLCLDVCSDVGRRLFGWRC
jgi:hypothetical protein